jgi:GTPase SAR1 family protein
MKKKIFSAIGFNVETVQVLHSSTEFAVSKAQVRDELCQYKNIKFQVWDLGGQSSIRLSSARSSPSFFRVFSHAV